MGLAILIFGLVLFLGTHVFVTARGRRAALLADWGDARYKLLFSLLSAIGLVLIVYGFGQYRSAGYIPVWDPPRWTRHVAALLVLLAVIFLFAAYLPGHIKRALKHPMLAGVKLWAVAHLLANGDLGSIILFGSFLAWAVYARIAAKRRERAGEALRPVPVSGWRNDVVAVAVGVLVYLGLGFVFHPLLIGVPAFSG
ncbi:MAG: hypothetical protein QOD74_186 [Variibacter sp.]|nr:hypothetical protein [Variibacter sp.]